MSFSSAKVGKEIEVVSEDTGSFSFPWPGVSVPLAAFSFS